ncbi:hypothetical protein [Lysinibacillus varians]|uniref:Uncharacterized protein n=1 Tax=Lysinibacillus varians TaxID=1145276 RepID=A0ABY2T471_9BACI|nr:hypothetical protein [Lysinibacillus varians]AHN24402.1 hypothetical protein T479_16910 [Lysinibacillus varians]TKI51298.1 hypothetical protein FC752_22250 [Lysinibacillus varians]
MDVLIEPIQLSFPIKQANVRISSGWLDRLDIFTKFVFKMIVKGYGEEEIQSVTKLQKHLILEEIHRLQDWGLIEKDYKLTNLGENYEVLLEIIEDFNKEEPIFYINLFNGQVLLEKKEFVLEPKGKKMKSNVTWVQTQGANFNNVQEQFIQTYLFTHPLSGYLSLEAIEALDIWLEIEKETPTVYYLKTIESLANLPHSQLKRQMDDLLLQLKVPSLKVKIDHVDLIRHRTVLSTLSQLEKYDASLISSDAQKLLKLNDLYTTELKHEEKVYYWNPLNNHFTLKFEEQTKVQTNSFKIIAACLPPTELFIKEVFEDLPEGFKVFVENVDEKIYTIHACSKELLEELI